MELVKEPALHEFGLVTPDIDGNEVHAGQEAVVADAHAVQALEDALMDHHLALRQFIEEWIESQKQLLSRKTLRVTDRRGAQKPTRADVQSADDFLEPIRHCAPEGSAWPNNPAQFMAEPAICVVPVDDEASDKPSNSKKSKTLHEIKATYTEPKSTDQEMMQILMSQWSQSVNNFLEGVFNGVNNRVACPLINRLEASRPFSCITGLVILLNAICMAVSADYEMNHFQEPTNKIFVTIELAFIIIYSVELVIRIVARRLAFFLVGWSWFDIVIVGVGWLEVLSSSSTSLTQVRLMRVLKMMKVMRVLRVMRSLREVRLLLYSLMGSVKPLLWTVIIITGINFMFGICFVQSIAAFRHDNWEKGVHGDGQVEVDTFYSSWTSVPQAMYTLFKVSTGGVSWGEVSDPLLTLGWSTFGIFLLYVALFMFVMANAVTAIFVSSAEEYAKKDEQNMMYDQLAAKKEFQNQVKPLYEEMDVDNSGEVTRSEFLKYMSDPRMGAFASSLNIETVDLNQFFDVLSRRGKTFTDAAPLHTHARPGGVCQCFHRPIATDAGAVQPCELAGDDARLQARGGWCHRRGRRRSGHRQEGARQPQGPGGRELPRVARQHGAALRAERDEA